MPNDKAIAYCTINPPTHRLATVIKDYSGFIESATGTPVHLSSVPDNAVPVAVSCSAVKNAQVEVCWHVISGKLFFENVNCHI